MPLFRMNIRDGKLDDQAQPEALPKALIQEIKTLPEGAPIIILLHGYNFSPFRKLANPHRHILSYHPDPNCWKAISWPRHLGFGRGRKGEGLCLAVGWNAIGSLRQVYARAKPTGQVLAKIIDIIHEIAPERTINIVAHSLGARVALSVLPALKTGRIGRMILLAGAEFCATAIKAMDCPAGKSVEVFNITSRENDFYDFLFEWQMGRARKRGYSISTGLHNKVKNWLDLQMDHAVVQLNIRQAGYKLARTKGRVCHWSTYLRGGVFPFYSAILRHPILLNFDRLSAMAPVELDRRWCKFLPKIRSNFHSGRLANMN